MLFTYPVVSLTCNWLNDNIITSLVDGMLAIDGGGTPVAWPNCLPNAVRKRLQGQSGLKTKLKAVWTVYADLTPNQRATVRDVIAQQTNIPTLYRDTALNCAHLNALPAKVRPAVEELAEYAFDKLSSLKVDGRALRDIHFKTIQDSGVKVCPFCGLQNFQPAGLKRNALDHLMPISKYPFVSSDFRNLPPACHDCNSLYKKDTDVLYDSGGKRRSCCDPYSGPAYKVSLLGSRFGEGNTIRGYKMPKWSITLVGKPGFQASTWDAVYSVKLRYEYTLDRDFIDWIKRFALWLVREDSAARSALPPQIAEELPRYIENVVQEGFDDAAFLKAEAFQVIISACADEEIGEETQAWLADFVYYAT
nr:hypothetical protein [Acetobacter persici]